MDIPPVRSDVQERLRQRLANRRSEEMRASELAAPTEKANINSDIDMEKTLAEVFEQCGFGAPIENPLRHMKPGTAEWERLLVDDKNKAFR